IVPLVASPPVTPFTLQVTAWFVVPVTVAKNCWVSPMRTVVVDGVTLTVICCGGGPELPHPQTKQTTKARGNDKQRLDMSHLFLLHPGTAREDLPRPAMPFEGWHTVARYNPRSQFSCALHWPLSGQVEAGVIPSFRS